MRAIRPSNLVITASERRRSPGFGESDMRNAGSPSNIVLVSVTVSVQSS